MELLQLWKKVCSKTKFKNKCCHMEYLAKDGLFLSMFDHF